MTDRNPPSPEEQTSGLPGAGTATRASQAGTARERDQ
jgi:hypothetical protein